MLRTDRVVLGVAIVTVTLVMGCSAGLPASSPVGTLPTGSTTSLQATPPSGASAGPGSGGPAVDLTFSGTVDLHAAGTAGTCQIGHSGSARAFGFTATGADYAGLGQSFHIEESLEGRVDTKWLVDSSRTWFGYLDSGVTVSADHLTMTLDTDMPVHPGMPEHVKGTISCPG